MEDETTSYECPRCGTRREFSEDELIRWVFDQSGKELEDTRFTFQCTGCPLRVFVGLTIEELPSWSGNARARLEYELTERVPAA